MEENSKQGSNREEPRRSRQCEPPYPETHRNIKLWVIMAISIVLLVVFGTAFWYFDYEISDISWAELTVRPVAKVNNEVISRKDLRVRLKNAMRMMEQQYGKVSLLEKAEEIGLCPWKGQYSIIWWRKNSSLRRPNDLGSI